MKKILYIYITRILPLIILLFASCYDDRDNPYDGKFLPEFISSFSKSKMVNKEMLTFSINGEAGIINGNQIAVNLPCTTTNVASLAAEFSFSGDRVEVGGIEQDSGITTNNYTNPVTFTIVAQDSSTQDYIVTVTAGRFFQSYLKAPNNSNYDNFGGSVAISGDTIVVGAPYEDSTTTNIINGTDLSTTNNSGTYNGAAYVFTRSGSTWSHQAYLKAPNNSNLDDFGISVAIYNDTIVVGAFGEDSTTTNIINGTDLSTTNNLGNSNGAAYVFTRSGSTWSHQAYLKSPNNSDSDYFGTAVDIYNNTIVVGAPWENSTTTNIINGTDLSTTNNSGNNNGAAYVFTRSGSIWSHQAYLKAPNNSNLDEFGIPVAIYNDTIAVGARSEYSTTNTIINGSNLSSTNNSGNANGAVYVFTRAGTTWSHQAYLKSSNNSNEDYFGRCVAIYNNTIAVGASHEDSNTTKIMYGSDLSTTNNSGFQNGAAYIFVRSGSTWAQQAYLKAPKNSDGELFGVGVGIDVDTIVVGSIFENSTSADIINGDDLSSVNNDGINNGAVYVFICQ